MSFFKCKKRKKRKNPIPPAQPRGKVIDSSMSIERSLSELKDEVLYLRGGIYKESIINKIPNGKTISAYKKERVIIRPDDGNFIFQFQGDKEGFGQRTSLVGLILDGVNIKNVGVKYTRGASYNSILECEFINTDFSGILCNDNSNYNRFTRNYLHDFGSTKWEHAIYIASSYNQALENIISGIGGNGVQVYWSSSKTVESNYVAKNKISRCGKSGSGSGIILTRGSNHKAFENAISDCPQGISVRYGAIDAQLKNNDVSNNDVGLLIGKDVTYTEENTVYGNNRVEKQILK